jgi:hypothetical protein
VANKCGLFFKASGIESGGANSETGLRTGTLVSISGVSPLVLPAVGTVYTAYFRAIDDTTGDDPGQDSVTDTVFTPPAHLQVCATYNGTFTSSPLDVGVKCIGGNQPVYLKQTELAASTSAALTVGALEWAAGTRVAQVGTVTPTAGDASVALAWSAISGAAGYEVRRATDSGMSANLVVLTTACGTNAYTNNTGGGNAPANGTGYYYQVRAYAATGASPWSAASAVATPAAAASPPANVTAVAIDYLANKVAFDAVSGASSYNLYWTSDGTDPTKASTKIAGVTSPYIHSSLTATLTYKYAVTAVVSGVETAVSSIVSAVASNVITFEVAQTPYSAYNGTFARVTDQAHAGTYSSKVTGVASGWGPKLTKPVTMPSADSTTVNFSRWFRIDSLPAVTSRDAVIIGLAPDQAVSAWGPIEVSIAYDTGVGLGKLMNQIAGSHEAVYASALTANKWYKVTVALNTGTDNRGTYTTTLYDSDGTTVLGTKTSVCITTGWKSASKYLVAGCYECGTAFNMWLDDIQDGL